MAGALPIDPEEWDLVIDKLVRLHDNIQLEIVELVAKIKQEMNGTGSSMVPLAEDKSNFGKVRYWLDGNDIKKSQTYVSNYFKMFEHVVLTC